MEKKYWYTHTEVAPTTSATVTYSPPSTSSFLARARTVDRGGRVWWDCRGAVARSAGGGVAAEAGRAWASRAWSARVTSDGAPREEDEQHEERRDRLNGNEEDHAVSAAPFDNGNDHQDDGMGQEASATHHSHIEDL